MSLILLDGCEDYSSLSVSGSKPSIVAGRYQNCFSVPTGGIDVVYSFLPAQESDTITFGGAFKLSSFSSAVLIEAMSDNSSTQHTRVQLSSDGHLEVQRQITTLCSTTPGLVTSGVWYYIELQIKLHDTTGFCTLRLNGAQVASATNVDTKFGGTKTTYDTIRFEAPTSVPTLWDDIYICAGAGDTFLGPLTVETILPNADGNANQWMGSDGNTVSNYQLVDEPNPLNLNDYVFSTTVGQQDLYNMGNLVHTDGTIVGVCHSAHMVRTDALTAMNVKLVNRRAADNKSASFAIGTSYRGYEYCLTQDPETSAAWTIANINNLQSGVELA